MRTTDRGADTLFDLGRRPGLREVADAVRAAGSADGLPDAVARGDGVRYQEVSCRTALNRVAGMPFQWTLNPYRGCAHGCHFCYARRYQTQMELDPGADFSSVVLVKTNFAAVLDRELARRPRAGDRIALGTATDPYQPIEGRYRITRRTLEALLRRPAQVGLITRGPLAVRDADLLAALSRRTRCTVTISLPTVDDDAWAALEPGTAPPQQRLRAVRTLCEAGVDAGVMMAPIVPGISSHPAKLIRTLQAIADSGAAFVGAGLLHLEDGTRQHFLEVLGKTFPHLVEGYGRLYAGTYAAPDYTARFRTLLGLLTAQHDLRRRWADPTVPHTPPPARGEAAGPDAAPRAPRQARLTLADGARR